jgi:outer membrane protein assembly factor BamB
MRRTIGLLLASSVSTILLTSSHADDWPQWQGPNRNCISKETGLLKQWPKEGPALAWKTPALGGGDGAPSVAGGRVFGMSHRGADEVVWALSEKEGKELWAKVLRPAYKQDLPQSKEGPSCTPTVDGDRLYVEGMAGDVACLKVADGALVWQCNLQKDFGGIRPTWSYRESVLVDGDKVICTPGGETATMVALDKMTGNLLWKSFLPGGNASEGAFANSRAGAAYASPIAFDFEGRRQYAQLAAKALIGVDAKDGKLLWTYDKPANSAKISCSTPVFYDGHVIAASAYGAGAGAVKLKKNADGSVTAEEVWATRKLQNHHGGILVFDGCVYGANGGNEGGTLVCLDFKTGNVLWDQKAAPQVLAPKGSVAMADGLLYYRTEKGAVLLIEPSAKEYIERGRFDQPDRTKLPAWAHPVVANGRLYVRDQDLLLCYDVKAKGS